MTLQQKLRRHRDNQSKLDPLVALTAMEMCTLQFFMPKHE
uniref:Uncharacterized protein n=1 Tax=Rhizophora mucronata TaxID=61149 RepID=A0A2P2N011_RHIMU